MNEPISLKWKICSLAPKIGKRKVKTPNLKRSKTNEGKKVPEQYIFNESAKEVFQRKLEKLHKNYVYHLLMNGVAPIGTNLDSIKMTKNRVANDKYCDKVVKGLLNSEPKIISKSIENGRLSSECAFFKIDDKEKLNHVFMVQNTINWPTNGSFSCHIWYLGETTMKQIKELWDE